jgi:UDP-glucose 4-epimerase
VIAATEAVVDRKIEVREAPRRGGDPPELVAKIDRAREVLGWAPLRSSLEEMVGSAWAERRARAGRPA